MRVLGIDVGIKRTGLALSDESGIAIRILPNLLAHSRKAALEKILSLVHEFEIGAIVIGCPEKKTTGSIAIASRAEGLKVALLAELAKTSPGVTVHLWGEEMTSKKAMTHLVSAKVPQKKRRAMLDGASAAVLVEEFIYFMGTDT